MKRRLNDNGSGSIELVVLGLLAALIIVLAVPVISDVGNDSKKLPRHSSAAWIR